MSKRLYDERLEIMSQEDANFLSEMDYARRDLVSPVVRMNRLRQFRRVVKIDQLYADHDFKALYDLRIMQIDRMLEGLDFALKMDIMQCPL